MDLDAEGPEPGEQQMTIPPQDKKDIDRDIDRERAHPSFPPFCSIRALNKLQDANQ